MKNNPLDTVFLPPGWGSFSGIKRKDLKGYTRVGPYLFEGSPYKQPFNPLYLLSPGVSKGLFFVPFRKQASPLYLLPPGVSKGLRGVVS